MAILLNGPVKEDQEEDPYGFEEMKKKMNFQAKRAKALIEEGDKALEMIDKIVNGKRPKLDPEHYKKAILEMSLKGEFKFLDFGIRLKN